MIYKLGFDDALKTLDQLKCLSPNLPVDKSTKKNHQLTRTYLIKYDFKFSK